jgi:hypothetical protein
MIRKNRWYDAHDRLAHVLEWLKELPNGPRNRIVKQVIDLLNGGAPGLLEKYLLEFPLDQERRRWYDRDPFLWLMVNGLRYANPDLLHDATMLMERAVHERAGGQGEPHRRQAESKGRNTAIV